MADMDIYMRRRLVALGGLVLFFIFFVLLVKSCGGDDEPQPVAPVSSGATGGTGATALAEADYIAQADEICAQANASVGALDPADTTGEPQDEYLITNDELSQVNTLELADASPDIEKFLRDLGDVVVALKDKAKATKAGGDTATAQTAIDTAEVAARTSGERAGFAECGQFLDAGESPSTGGNGNNGTGTGTVTPPTDTGGVTVTPTTPAPTTPTTPTTPPADGGTDTGGGGITP